MDRNAVLTARSIEAMIAEGHTVLIFGDDVLRLDAWLAKHPGGSLPIMHMVGKDATDEMTVYHSLETLATMRRFRIGKKPPGPWTNMTPPIRGGVYRREESEESLLEKDAVEALEEASDVNESEKVVKVDSPQSVRKRTPPLKEPAVEYQAPIHKSTGDFASSTGYADAAMQQEIDQAIRDYPSLEMDVQEEITSKFRDLHQRIRDEGFYDCPFIEYGKELARYSCLFGGFLTALHYGWYMTSAAFLGLFWHQIMFTAHDAAHVSITHNFTVDSLIAMFVGDFCCGLSIGWWKSSHNVHHLITNHPEHDPDIQNVPLFATCPSFFKSLRSTYYNFTFVWDKVADIMVPYQRYTYYPVMGIARFNLYLLSWIHLLSNRSSSLGTSKAWWIRPTEIFFMCCYWFLFGYCLLWRTLPTWNTRIAFILVSHVITMPLHVQITLSHWGMSTSELGETESFAQRQLRTTMDVKCPAWLDFIHGGLQFQAVHHLFPRVPRHNLRKVQTLVREFCAETEIPYSILNFTDGNRKMLGRLDEVSHQLKMLVECQQYMAETGESGLH